MNKEKKKKIDLKKKKKKKKKLPKKKRAQSLKKGKKKKKGKGAYKRPLAKKPQKKKKKKNDKKQPPKVNPASTANEEELNARETRTETIKKGLIELTSKITGTVYNEKSEINEIKSEGPSPFEKGVQSLLTSFEMIAKAQTQEAKAAETKEERDAKQFQMRQISAEIEQLQHQTQYLGANLNRRMNGLGGDVFLLRNHMDDKMKIMQQQLDELINEKQAIIDEIEKRLEAFKNEIKEAKKNGSGVPKVIYETYAKNTQNYQDIYKNILKEVSSDKSVVSKEELQLRIKAPPRMPVGLQELFKQLIEVSGNVAQKQTEIVNNMNQGGNHRGRSRSLRNRSPSPESRSLTPTPRIRGSTPIKEDGKEAFKKFAIYYKQYIGWSQWSKKLPMDVETFWRQLVVEFKDQNTIIKINKNGSVINTNKQKQYDSWVSIGNNIDLKKDSIIFFLNNKAASIKDRSLPNEKISLGELSKILKDLNIKNTGL